MLATISRLEAGSSTSRTSGRSFELDAPSEAISRSDILDDSFEVGLRWLSVSWLVVRGKESKKLLREEEQDVVGKLLQIGSRGREIYMKQDARAAFA